MERPISLAFLVPLFLSSTLSITNALQINQSKGPPCLNRREMMGSISVFTTALIISPQTAKAVYNPLNLQGSYWETGELYVKKESGLPKDPDELLPSLLEVAPALESLNSLVLEGRFEELSRKLRGGVVSESRIRLRGYALLDILPSENSRLAYICTNQFRTFLVKFANLDQTVEAAVRQSKIDGGLLETLLMAPLLPFNAANEVVKISKEPGLSKDPRLNVLASLEEAIKAANDFTKAAEEALKFN